MMSFWFFVMYVKISSMKIPLNLVQDITHCVVLKKKKKKGTVIDFKYLMPSPAPYSFL